MKNIGLRFDQAPPFLVPLRFFLTAPVFGAAAALLLLAGPPEILMDRWHPLLLAATHLLTLGFLTMAMIGALLQMLPVLAGSPLKHPRAIGAAVHALLVGGTLALAASFIIPTPVLRHAALAALAGGLATILFAAGSSLARAQANPSVIAMRIALAGLTLTALLGLLLGSGHVPAVLGAMPAPANLHIGWGLVGWVAVLVIGVGYQVVPMFQLTRAYPARLRNWLAPLLAAALVLWTIGTLAPRLIPAWLGSLGLSALGIALAVFAVTTLWLQTTRKRRLSDATTRFWMLSMISLLASIALAAAYVTELTADTRLMRLAVVWTLVGFGVSVILGMLYKIVPFLAWLHLQTHNVRDLPNMKDIVPDSRTLPHVWLHGFAVALFAPACFAPSWLYPAALALCASFAWLGWNLICATQLYHRVSRRSAPSVQPN